MKKNEIIYCSVKESLVIVEMERLNHASGDSTTREAAFNCGAARRMQNKKDPGMKKIMEGVQKFRAESFPSRRDLFGQLARGHRPEVLFITCSDSRSDPNLLTQSAPGDLFALRNAGNIVPPFGAGSGGEAATIEYAVTALGVKDIVICGHSLCGAMKGLVQSEQLTNLPAVASWLTYAETSLRNILSRVAG